MRAPEHGRCRRALFTAAFSALGMLVLSCNSTAGDWRVLPRLNLLETYTDNVRLGGVGGGVGAFGGGGECRRGFRYPDQSRSGHQRAGAPLQRER